MKFENHGDDSDRAAPIVTVDAHVHPSDYLPRPASRLFRWFIRSTVPPETSFADFARAGTDVVVANAVGDRVVTAWWARGAWGAVQVQLARIRAEVDRAGGAIVTTPGQLLEAKASGRVAVILGVEGGDVIGSDLDRLGELARMGVRFVVPVHMTDNRIGTTCLPFQRYLGNLPVLDHRPRGLTAFGRRVIARMNELGMVVDVSHADAATLSGMVEVARRPLIASHSGAKAIQAFERYLDDEQIRAVAATGGVIGLWPYLYKGEGVADLDTLMRHARHIAELVGPAHLCVGTDTNGTPGMMAGYRRGEDLGVIRDGLAKSGFDPSEIDGIMGANLLRVFDAVTHPD